MPRVALLADDLLARGALAAALRRVGIEPLSEEPLVPGPRAAEVLLIDLGVDPRAGLSRARPLLAGAEPAVVLSDRAELAVELLAAGARGVLPRSADGARLAAALEAVAQGLWVLDSPPPALLGGDPSADAAPTDPLTPRELEVLQLLARGLANKAIAERLEISENTVKFHLAAITGKLGVSSRTEAVVKGAKLGLIYL
jgi:DNA-binding NarL/FixJ family response regulator